VEFCDVIKLPIFRNSSHTIYKPYTKRLSEYPLLG